MFVLIVVCAALIRGDGRVLVQQRPLASDYGGYWEFPGGKVEAGERLAQALVRELAEELGVTVPEERLTPLCFASGPASGPPLLLLLYRCTQWVGEPRLLHAAALDWFDPVALRALRMPPADRPLVDALIASA